MDRIKDIGNKANHVIHPIDPAQGLDVTRFTEQLLVLAYEMKALMDAADGPPTPLTRRSRGSGGLTS